MISLFLSFAACDRWAVIFAGSNTWFNYRHQADSFNQYRLLVEGGIPKDHIIMLNYDDICWFFLNPYRGKMFQTLDHVDIYPGAEASDYNGWHTTAKNFYAVLDGTATGKSLKSTSEDYVYLFYDNHGGDGILGVPHLCGDYIFANDLKNKLQEMQEQGKFKKCFFPITSCYAGSVAREFNDIKDLYSMTASAEAESSFSMFYDTSLQVYLTSQYSYYKDQFIETFPDGTIEELLEYTKEKVDQSHVSEYGDVSLKKLPLSTFVGTRQKKALPNEVPANKNVVRGTSTLARTLELRNDGVSKARLAFERDCEARVDKVINGLKSIFPLNADIKTSCQNKNWDSYKAVLRHMHNRLGYLGESFYDKTFFFSHLSSVYSSNDIISQIDKLL